MPKWLKIVLTIVAVLAAIVITLFVAAKIAGYTFIGLIQYLMAYLEYIWTQRIFK